MCNIETLPEYFTCAFIEGGDANKLDHEASLVVEYLNSINFPFTIYTTKSILRRSLALSKKSFLVGNLTCLYGGMKQLGLKAPDVDCYPKVLEDYLHRNVWSCSIAELKHLITLCDFKPIFVKPKNSHKKFIGQVFSSVNDLYFINHMSDKDVVYCVDEVNWVSEYRVYVVKTEIRAICHYDGDPSILLNYASVESAIFKLGNAPNTLSAYAIDFGVLDTGETALIEVNDGFSIGAYGVNPKDYTELLMTRWYEIVSSHEPRI